MHALDDSRYEILVAHIYPIDIANARKVAADADCVQDVKNLALRDVYDHGGWLGLSISEDHVAARENTFDGHCVSKPGVGCGERWWG